MNPAAGGGRGVRLWRRIESGLRARWPGLVPHLTRSTEDAVAAVAAWAGGGGDLLVVGGDGTLHEAVNAVVSAGRLDQVRVGLIPAGTGNDFARSLGSALGALPAAVERRVDLGRLRFEDPSGSARQLVFLNSASLGLSVRGNAIAHRARRILPGAVCYVLGGVGAILTERRRLRRSVRAELDGRVIYEGRALNITVANGETFGSGLRIAPGSSIADGLLDLVVVRDVGRAGAAVVFLALLRGAHPRLASVDRTEGRRVRVVLEERAAMEADGNMFEARGEVHIEVQPGALRVIRV